MACRARDYCPSQPVSRILSPASRVTVISLGRQLPDASSSLPEADNGTSSPSLLLGLAPGGVCLAAAVTVGAGGPLTPPFHPRSPDGSNTLLCGTLPSSRLAWLLASTVLCGVRTFLTPTWRGATVRLAWARPILTDNRPDLKGQPDSFDRILEVRFASFPLEW